MGTLGIQLIKLALKVAKTSYSFHRMTGYNLGNFTIFLAVQVSWDLEALLLPPSIPILLHYSLFFYNTCIFSLFYSLEIFNLLSLAEL